MSQFLELLSLQDAGEIVFAYMKSYEHQPN